MIKDIKIGPITDVFYIANITLDVSKTGSNKVFSGLTLKDKTGTLKAICWEKHLDATVFKQGKFVQISGTVRDWNGQKSLNFNDKSIMVVDPPANANDYIFALDELTIQKYWDELVDGISQIQDKDYQKICEEVLKLKLKSAILTDESYGNYPGAWLEHIVYSVRLAGMTYLKFSDRATNINPDLLTAIIITHDVGRLFAFENLGTVNKTAAAQLLGVDILAHEWLDKVPDIPYDKLIKIKHGILVCNNKYVKPMFIEALLAKNLQEIDATLSIYSHTLKYTKSSEQFSKFSELLNTTLYNG